MWAKIKNSIYNFMRGRYGIDTLSNFLMWTGLILVFINIFFNNTIIYALAWFCIIYAYVRIFSKKYDKRNSQNEWFLNKTKGVREWYHKKIARMRIRRTHHIYTCPGCRQKIKIPKGKGLITITCPKCRIEFTKKS